MYIQETQLNNYASNQSNSLLKTISFTYTGSKDINGNKQGFGIQKWTDSSKYIGQFNENKAAGIGIFFHPDGAKHSRQI